MFRSLKSPQQEVLEVKPFAANLRLLVGNSDQDHLKRKPDAHHHLDQWEGLQNRSPASLSFWLWMSWMWKTFEDQTLHVLKVWPQVPLHLFLFSRVGNEMNSVLKLHALRSDFCWRNVGTPFPPLSHTSAFGASVQASCCRDIMQNHKTDQRGIVGGWGGGGAALFSFLLFSSAFTVFGSTLRSGGWEFPSWGLI